jgi:hypothetical protein
MMDITPIKTATARAMPRKAITEISATQPSLRRGRK